MRSSIVASVIATLAFIAGAAAANPLAKRDYYANFFDDSNCSQNGGIGVSIHNPGCLAEGGRGSVYIPNTGLGGGSDNQFCLVKTFNDGGCSCQNQGYDFTATGFCAVLDPSVQSYRFIGGSCGPNNC